jgi:hypothetical protein
MNFNHITCLNIAKKEIFFTQEMNESGQERKDVKG